MPMARALIQCPQLLVLPGDFRAYSRASKKVMEHLGEVTDCIEQISIDEAYLDVSEIQEDAETLARRLQAIIRAELDLPCSIGVASNKLVAKVATDAGKAAARGEGPPNAILVVPPGQEAAFLAPLPVEVLPGIGPKTTEFLAGRGIHTVGQLAQMPDKSLEDLFGKLLGHELFLKTQGIDHRPVETSHAIKSISRETTFPRDLSDGVQLRETLNHLSESVSRRLHRENLAGTTVKIKLRWADFTTLSRQVTLKQPTNQSDEIYQAALHLFDSLWTPKKPVRLLGVGVSGLRMPYKQLSLWEVVGEKQSAEKKQRLQQALDQLRRKYGDDILRRGGLDQRK